MNKLSIGFSNTVEPPTRRGYLFIDDDVPDVPGSRVFDPAIHSFNPLAGIDEKKARELAELLYLIFPQGENTLTVRNGRRALAPALLKAGRLDKVEGDEEVNGLIADILFTPIARQVLCKPTNFSFNVRTATFARINRAELGERDALLFGLLLMHHYRGQLVVPDLGFYGRNAHANLVREDRLIGGVAFLDELPEKLRQACLSIETKTLTHASSADAELIAKLSGYVWGTNGFLDFIERATD